MSTVALEVIAHGAELAPFRVQGQLPKGCAPEDALLHLMFLLAVEAARRSDPQRVITTLAADISPSVVRRVIDILTPRLRIGDMFQYVEPPEELAVE